MKLSDYRIRRTEYWYRATGCDDSIASREFIKSQVGKDVERVEYRGVAWDPETTPEIPKKLCPRFTDQGSSLVPDEPGGKKYDRTEVEVWHREAARRYNNYEEAINYLKQMACNAMNNGYSGARETLKKIGEW